MTLHYHATRARPARARVVRRGVRGAGFTMPRWMEMLLAKWIRWTRYDDYLGSLVWRSKRERALQRADYACQLCNAKKGGKVWLEVHHRQLDYQFQFGCEDDNDLTVLCNKCHGRFHGE